MHVMLDLETLSTAPNAAIISIGAVKFEPRKPGREMERFHVGIDVRGYGSFRDKFDLSADTLAWWLNTDRAEALADWRALEKVDLGTALYGFAEWLRPPREGDPAIEAMWGNGSDFDNKILAHAYEALFLETPWHYRANRCFRTLRAITQVKADDTGLMAHNAVNDAQMQAEHLQKIYTQFRGRLE